MNINLGTKIERILEGICDDKDKIDNARNDIMLLIEKDLEATSAILDEFKEHEERTHHDMGEILGFHDSFLELTREMKAENEKLKAAMKG